MELIVPPLSQKWLFFSNLGQGLSQNVGFFFIIYPIFKDGFLDKMLALSSKKSTFMAF